MKDPARKEFSKEHMSLVKQLVTAEYKKLGMGVDVDDLRSFAMEGYASALERYDPSRNTSFKSFAKPRIRGAIYDGLRQNDWFPKNLRRKINYYRKSEEIVRSYSDTPPPKDKVEALHRLSDTLKELATAYVTTYVADSENEPAVQPAEAEIAVDRKRFGEQLRNHINELPANQQQVIRTYFFDDLDLATIADRMGISTSWASKLLKAALHRLRISFGDDGSTILDVFQPPPG
ncbi:MAG: sigma-70 family RNA polymerase sigma factor [Proteobacteria bacterium]|nr:sigma-70 family RNA polymerase sigma factor [Pseudomonadota bacterium]